MANTINEIRLYCNTANISNHSRHISVELGDVDATEIEEFVRSNRNPEDIFSETQLEKWAEANGYIKGGEQ